MWELLAIVLGSLSVFLGGLFVWVGISKHECDDVFSVVCGCVTLIGFLAVFIFGIVWGSLYVTSYNRIQTLSAFQNETMSAYEYTIDRTERVVIDISGTREGAFTDFSYQQQGQAVSERIKEFRDRIDAYNMQLYSLMARNRLPVFGAMYYDVPGSLKPIRLSSTSTTNP